MSEDKPRLLAIGTFHFVDKDGFQLDTPEIEWIGKVIVLNEDDDPDEIGESFHEAGFDSYNTFYPDDPDYDDIEQVRQVLAKK